MRGWCLAGVSFAFATFLSATIPAFAEIIWDRFFRTAARRHEKETAAAASVAGLLVTTEAMVAHQPAAELRWAFQGLPTIHAIPAPQRR